MQKLSGIVVKGQVATGSKSEREAVLLDTDGQRFILRRQHGNPFHDEELEKLVGKKICADGNLIGGRTFLMSQWVESSF
jgi:hypothetical protein